MKALRNYALKSKFQTNIAVEFALCQGKYSAFLAACKGRFELNDFYLHITKIGI